MAFQMRNLQVLTYANGFTLWSYKTKDDTLAAIGSTGYFNASGDLLKAGDMILNVGRDGGTIRVATGAEVQIDGEWQTVTVPLS